MFLEKKFRLPKYRLKSLRDNSKRINTSLLNLVYSKQPGQENFRLSVISGKKVDRSAVNRNRAKRQIQRFFFQQKQNSKLNGYDLLVICRKAIIGKQQIEVDRELLNIINKI